LYPSRSATWQPPYDQGLAAIPESDAKARGIAIGREVGAKILALRQNDGRSVVLAAYVPGTAPGRFRGSNPINQFMPYMKPFALTSLSQVRAPGPAALDSAQYASDVNETKAMAGTASTARSAQQTEVARFHTEPPPAFQGRNYRKFAASRTALVDNARLSAQLWTAVADATLACFESKYTHNFWRPTSAIQLADTDGNALTDPDPAWTPFVPTPNHPEYPAAHSCTHGAIAQTLRRHFGTRDVTWTMDSTVTGTTHTFHSTDEFMSETTLARIWGGMHFRTSVEHGAALGAKVADWVADNYFRPTN
jgi:hypothetical protein